MPLQSGDRQCETDAEGYLKNLGDWNERLAEQIAATEGIQLGAAHWELISLIRQFYREFQLSPAMRPLIKYARQQLGAEKASSQYFLTLFPDSPAKRLSKIAGLPRPENCL